MRALTLTALLSLLGHQALANPAFEGDWFIDITTDRAPLMGVLEVERHGDEWKAWVEGGPAPVTIEGDRIVVDVDSRDIRGFIFIMRLDGKLENGRITGSYSIHADATPLLGPGTWVGAPYDPPERSSEPDPVDFSGIWKPGPGVDIRKYSMDLTPAAEEWHAGYVMHYDQPGVRCISPGIVAMVAWGAYPFEVLDTQDRLTFLYEVDSEVRRIHLEERERPEFYPPSGMGFSLGRWEGDALVGETTNMMPNVRDFRGEPVSGNAMMHEVYTLSEDGQRLDGVITLHDPENYERPPVRRRHWVRDPGIEIYPYECDPDSFYRQMYNEGKLDMYFERSKRRM